MLLQKFLAEMSLSSNKRMETETRPSTKLIHFMPKLFSSVLLHELQCVTYAVSWSSRKCLKSSFTIDYYSDFYLKDEPSVVSADYHGTE
jgi:hypothetical protein